MRPPQLLPALLALLVTFVVTASSDPYEGKLPEEAKQVFFFGKIEPADSFPYTRRTNPTLTPATSTTPWLRGRPWSTHSTTEEPSTTSTDFPFGLVNEEFVEDEKRVEALGGQETTTARLGNGEEPVKKTTTPWLEEAEEEVKDDVHAPWEIASIDVAKIREKHAAEPENLDMDEIMAMNLDMECHCLKKRSASGEARKVAAKYRVDLNNVQEIVAPVTTAPVPTTTTTQPPPPTTTDDSSGGIVRRDCDSDGCCCFTIDCPDTCDCPKKCRKPKPVEDDCCGVPVSLPCFECPCSPRRRDQCSNIVPWDQCACQVNWNRPYACPSPYANTQLASIRRLQWYLAQGFRILQLLNQSLPCLAQQGSSQGGGYGPWPLWGPQQGYPGYPLWGPTSGGGYPVPPPPPPAPAGYPQPPKPQGYVTPGYPVPSGGDGYALPPSSGYALPPVPGPYPPPQPGYPVPQPYQVPQPAGYDAVPGGSDWHPYQPQPGPYQPQPGPYDPYQGGPQQQQPQPGPQGYQPPIGQGAQPVPGPLGQHQQQEFVQGGQPPFGANAQQAPGAPQPLRSGPQAGPQSAFGQFPVGNAADRNANRPPKQPRFYDNEESDDRRPSPTRPPRSSPAKPAAAEAKTSSAMPSAATSIVGTVLAMFLALCLS